MSTQNTLFKLSQIEESIHPSRWLSPLNLSEERAKFLESPRENPQVVYPEVPLELLEKSLKDLNSITTEELNAETLEGWIAGRKFDELRLRILLFLRKDTSEFSAISQELFLCSFGQQYVDMAAQHAKIDREFISQETKTPDQIVTDIQLYLQEYGVFDWSVELSEQTDFYFRVKAAKKKILVSKNFNWDFTNFDAMLSHEIDGHVLRAINALKQPEILRKPLPFYIRTEEGLASFLGDYCSTAGEVNLKHHALKYLAGELARKSSFIEVYEFLMEHGFTSELAFQRTFRLKRGISDTSTPGCFTKEAVYYEGMLDVKKYLDEKGDPKKLYVGKVGLEDLPHIETSKEVVVPERLIQYLKK